MPITRLSLSDRKIFDHVFQNPGQTELEIACAVFGPGTPQQRVNPSMRRLSSLGFLIRDKTSGVYRYFVSGTDVELPRYEDKVHAGDVKGLSEDEIKLVLQEWLKAKDFECCVAMGRERGIDIDARSEAERWIIEVKGSGSRPEMRVNYFISMLGEVLQRMNDPAAKYFIALPDIQQFRRLWVRLPHLAKARTGISALFVSVDGSVLEES